jgi:hypothetical protein
MTQRRLPAPAPNYQTQRGPSSQELSALAFRDEWTFFDSYALRGRLLHNPACCSVIEAGSADTKKGATFPDQKALSGRLHGRARPGPGVWHSGC